MGLGICHSGDKADAPGPLSGKIHERKTVEGGEERGQELRDRKMGHGVLKGKHCHFSAQD